MSAAEIIANLSARHIADVRFWLGQGYTYAEARAFVAERSCAGPAVWAVVDAEFAGVAA